MFPFPVALENFLPFHCNSSDFCLTIGAFNSPPHQVTVLSTTAKLGINISDSSSTTTANYQTGRVVFLTVHLSGKSHVSCWSGC